MNPFETVKQNTSARQVAEFYGAKINKNGMCQCPFHSDKTPSIDISLGGNIDMWILLFDS